MSKSMVTTLAGVLSLGAVLNVSAQWQHTNDLVGKRINTLAVNEAYVFAGTADSGVYRSGDTATSWQAVNTGLVNQDVRALTTRGDYLFAGTFGGGVYRSADNGENWQAINTGISTLNIQALGGNDSFLFAGTSGGGVCRSSNNGENWLEVSTGLVHINIFSIGVTSNYVFVGTWGGSAFRTEDNGLNWFLVTNGLFHPSKNIIPYSFAAVEPYVYTGTGGEGVFRGKDSARVWFPFNTGLPDSSFVTALALIEDTLFAATHNGVFRSLANVNCTDNPNCADWVADNEGLEDTSVLSLAVSGNTLLAGTDGNGVWRRAFGEVELPVTVDRPTIARSALLGVGHFGKTFRYAIPSQSKVSLVAYDTKGRILHEYVSSQQSSGDYTINLQKGNMAAGPVYLLFKAGEQKHLFKAYNY